MHAAVRSNHRPAAWLHLPLTRAGSAGGQMWLWAWYPTWNTSGTDCAEPQFELTAEHGGLYGPRVDGPAQFNRPTTSAAFQDYFLAKTLEVTPPATRAS